MSLNKNVKWLLEPEVFEGEEEPILDALNKLEFEYEAIKFGTPYEDCMKCFKDTDCVVFHGSLQLGRLLQKEAKWTPGVYCNLPQFECVYYYPRFGNNLLNRDYVMLPFGELERRKEWLAELFGKKFFIRPSSGFKLFTGKVVSMDTWDEDLNLLAFYGVELETIVIVAPAVEITSEWRLLVVDNKVVTGSRYMDGFGFRGRSSKPHPEVLDYAQKILDESHYSPDSAWIFDICEYGANKLSVLEAGSFSCCGLYRCDPETVIQEVSRVAWRDWQAKQS